MSTPVSPWVILLVALASLGLAAYAGILLRGRLRPLADEERDPFDVVRGATLTLLGLIIGFSFAMAVSRYDQRKNYEEAEANAIGTEYLRADLLPAEEAAQVRALLARYLDSRIAFYVARDADQLARIDGETAALQGQLWSAAVTGAAKVGQTPVAALAVAGMNDVLNSQGYTQAAWWNRIPVAAWGLMALIAVACSLLVGYSERRAGALTLVLPVVISIAFFLISDIDSPRLGIINVAPQNLIALAQSLKPH